MLILILSDFWFIFYLKWKLPLTNNRYRNNILHNWSDQFFCQPDLEFGSLCVCQLSVVCCRSTYSWAEMDVMLRLFYLSCLPSVLSLSVTDKIARVVTDQITDLSTRQISENIQLHYRLLGLMDNRGRWVHQYFKKFSNGRPCFPRYIAGI